MGCSPINFDVLLSYLYYYPNYKDKAILSCGFEKGFKIDYTGPRISCEFKNLRSAFNHPAELLEKVTKEISLGRIAGPFDSPPFTNLRVSPVGLVPKSDGGWRMITHLSYPKGDSINDGIDKSVCSVKYTSFDKVTNMIYKLGKSALLAKRDLRSAYRILPIRIDDFPLFGFKVGNRYYVDKFLAMGLSQSANLFEKFSTFLHWVVANEASLDTLDHLLDDFIFAGKKGSGDCEILLETFSKVCLELGVPIAEEKSVEPTTVMVFLGLEIDTNNMLVRIPLHKIEELYTLLVKLSEKHKITLKELQSLVGKLNFFGQAVRSSRAFLRRFYDAMIPLSKPFHHLRVSREMKDDMLVWLCFLQEFNGISYIPEECWFSSDSLQLFTDSAGSADRGAACFLGGKWCFFPWPENWRGDEILRDMSFFGNDPSGVVYVCMGNDISKQKNNVPYR